MDRAIIDEMLEELSSALQRVEAQSSAVLELIRDKGVVKEDELAPYFERANAASSVRWRATRVRLEKLLSGLEKEEQQEAGPKHEEREEAAPKKDQPKEAASKNEAGKAAEPKAMGEPKKAEAERATEPQAGPRKAESEKSNEPKLAARHGSEKPPAESSQSRPSDKKQEPSQPEQPAHAAGRSSSGGSCEQEARPHEQTQSERTPTAEQSTGKPKRPKVA